MILAALLVIAGIIYWNFSQKEEIPSNIITPEKEKQGEFTLSAIILGVDEENKILTVRPTAGGNEIKVLLSDTTKIEKLTLPPFDPKNPPKGSITPEKSEAGFSDFKKDKYVFIKTKKDISSKSELGDVELVIILP